MTEKSLIELNKEPNIALKKISDRNGSRGGETKWPLCILHLILEQLMNGTPPTSIYQNIVLQLALTIPAVEV